MPKGFGMPAFSRRHAARRIHRVTFSILGIDFAISYVSVGYIPKLSSFRRLDQWKLLEGGPRQGAGIRAIAFDPEAGNGLAWAL
jgi:hypothetical protein